MRTRLSIVQFEKRRGFSLLELLITACLFLCLLLGAFTLILQEWRTLRAIHEARDIRENLEGALKLICRQLKMAGSYPASAALENIEPDAVSLFGDLGDSGTLERVRFYLDGTILRRREDRLEGDAWQSGSGLPVADNITDLSFTYYDRLGQPVSHAVEVAYIRIEIAGCGWREEPGRPDGFDLDPSRTGRAMVRHLRSGVAVRRGPG
jgi:type II secretory pathway component PulJ